LALNEIQLIDWIAADKFQLAVTLLDVYLVRPESALISCGTVQGISDHCGVLLDVEWAEKFLWLRRKD
jgi:hypothetical protein